MGHCSNCGQLTAGWRALLAGLLVVGLGFGALIGHPPKARAAFGESFDDITALASADWRTINTSSPIGSSATGWLQGNAAPFQGSFPAHGGGTNAYIASSWQNAAVGTDSVISNWLLSPELRLSNGDTISFWTRSNGCAHLSNGPDRLQVRLSTAGASADVGAQTGDVGDFTSLLKDINPNYAGDDDPTGATGYPCDAWAQFTLTLNGLEQPSTGRIAFRHYVVDTASNGWYLGVDDFAYSGSTAASPTETATETSTTTASPSATATATASVTPLPSVIATTTAMPTATATSATDRYNCYLPIASYDTPTQFGHADRRR